MEVRSLQLAPPSLICAPKPTRFYNGGLAFSIIVLIGIACISLFAFLLLVETRSHVTASFGDMGGIVSGTSSKWNSNW